MSAESSLGSSRRGTFPLGTIPGTRPSVQSALDLVEEIRDGLSWGNYSLDIRGQKSEWKRVSVMNGKSTSTDSVMRMERSRGNPGFLERDMAVRLPYSSISAYCWKEHARWSTSRLAWSKNRFVGYIEMFWPPRTLFLTQVVVNPCDQ